MVRVNSCSMASADRRYNAAGNTYIYEVSAAAGPDIVSGAYSGCVFSALGIDAAPGDLDIGTLRVAAGTYTCRTVCSVSPYRSSGDYDAACLSIISIV